MTVELIEDPADRRLAMSAPGLLRAFNVAGVIDAADVRVAVRLCELAASDAVDDTVALAVALTVRAVRTGSVCLDLRSVAEDTGEPDLPWPQPGPWLAAIGHSPLAGTPPVLRIYRDRLLYFDRYWIEEQQVCADLLARQAGNLPVDAALLKAGLDRVFHRPGSGEQRKAAEIALTQSTTVLTGGPGTGKTTTVAGLLALLAEHAGAAGLRRPRIALTAPTGKAAARLQEAVQTEIGNLEAADRARLSGLQAATLHRLLGRRPGSPARFRHHRGNRLPYDVIVVDETSMVSLTMMARLLEAVRPEARLIFVGDPDQLSSVEAGAVLADLADGLMRRGDTRIAELKTSHRFGECIDMLAQGIRAGDADRVLAVLSAGGPHVEFVDADALSASAIDTLRDVLVRQALQVRSAAVSGDAAGALDALDGHRLLCAHREGPLGVRSWNRQVERWLAEESGEVNRAEWYPGRPVLVTANDYGLGLYNGDTGVAVLVDGVLRAAMAAGGHVTQFATSRLAEVETMHAMTIHKSQGSQADEVTVLLPPEDSRLLSLELFYTAVTRAKRKIRIVGTQAQVRAALGRRVVRASGLRHRLAEGELAEGSNSIKRLRC